MIGPQLTAEVLDSADVETSRGDVDEGMASSYRMKSMIRIMIGIGMPSSQRRIPRPMSAPFRD
ncbi:hypothetical protein CHELA20_11037 [Hyphomicrobiales bacterium]|nr:hypothetical protein CHELA20_11037 [Hyphomicrobiales bacterium]CAH1694706.1 hypothetical protein CHELA41_51268 [Hyphomicrobiales bacterium]